MTTIDRFINSVSTQLLNKNCNFITMAKEYTIRKKIAKHGENSIIVIPKVLEDHLKPGTVMQLTIDVMEDAEK